MIYPGKYEAGAETHLAFAGDRLLARGTLVDVALAVRGSGDGATVFDARTGAVVDLNFSGSKDDVTARYSIQNESTRGRPKLGVTAREVTLLPRHWDWLASQPGGASAILRRLVEEASRTPEAERRARRDAAYRFMSAMAGDRPGFEEASRALFADRRADLDTLAAAWPGDIAAQIARYLDA